MTKDRQVSINFNAKKVFNHAYYPLLKSKYDYEIYWGGGGSGKSHHIAQKQIIKCLTQPTYGLMFCRKTAVSIRKSQFKLFCEIISKWKLNKEFHVKKSTMEIICKANGNFMVASGLDDVEKIKSVAGLTDVWVEEATECTEEDIDQLDLRVRPPEGDIQYIISFNPVDENHWIRQRFIPKDAEYVKNYEYSRSVFVESLDREIEMRYLVHHTTFEDNKFLPAKYVAKLHLLQDVNPVYYDIYCRGQWGRMPAQSPWVFNFDPQKHISADIQYNPQARLIFTLDFNIDPFACLVVQTWKDAKGLHTHFLSEIVIEKGGSIPAMAERIRSRFTAAQLATSWFTGDATGNNRQIINRDNVSSWKQLIKLVGVSDSQLKITKANPEVSTIRMPINTIFALHPDLKFHSSMRLTKDELTYTEAAPDGSIMKKDRTKKAQRSDALDAIRYFMINFLMADFEKQIDLKSYRD